jgi:hypothetical protein
MKPDTYHRQLLGAENLDSWEEISYQQFVDARAQRVSGYDWAFNTETHEYWVEGS